MPTQIPLFNPLGNKSMFLVPKKNWSKCNQKRFVKFQQEPEADGILFILKGIPPWAPWSASQNVQYHRPAPVDDPSGMFDPTHIESLVGPWQLRTVHPSCASPGTQRTQVESSERNCSGTDRKNAAKGIYSGCSQSISRSCASNDALVASRGSFARGSTL